MLYFSPIIYLAWVVKGGGNYLDLCSVLLRGCNYDPHGVDLP